MQGIESSTILHRYLNNKDNLKQVFRKHILNLGIYLLRVSKTTFASFGNYLSIYLVNETIKVATSVEV